LWSIPPLASKFFDRSSKSLYLIKLLQWPIRGFPELAQKLKWYIHREWARFYCWDIHVQ